VVDMRVFHFAALPGLASLLVAGVAFAAPAPTPSVDDMINSLTPGNVKSCATGACRGIRAGHSTGTAAAGSAPSAVTGGDEAALDLSVEFATNSAALTPDVKATLSKLGSALSSSKLATYKFRIEGHTDTTGDPERNQSLSEQRAKSVVSYLTSSFKIPASRLEAVGVGENDLAVPTPPQTAEAKNRRVHIVNLGS